MDLVFWRKAVPIDLKDLACMTPVPDTPGLKLSAAHNMRKVGSSLLQQVVKVSTSAVDDLPLVDHDRLCRRI
jgi:hypothetical protein